MTFCQNKIQSKSHGGFAKIILYFHSSGLVKQANFKKNQIYMMKTVCQELRFHKRKGPSSH